MSLNQKILGLDLNKNPNLALHLLDPNLEVPLKKKMAEGKGPLLFNGNMGFKLSLSFSRSLVINGPYQTLSFGNLLNLN